MHTVVGRWPNQDCTDREVSHGVGPGCPAGEGVAPLLTGLPGDLPLVSVGVSRGEGGAVSVANSHLSPQQNKTCTHEDHEYTQIYFQDTRVCFMDLLFGFGE
jgi:hypothetical protein